MKRETCYRYCQQIYKKLIDIDGVLLTPGYDHEYVRFKKIMVVGSFVKGKAEPNDLDLLIDCEEGGAVIRIEDGGILDKEYLRRYGIERVARSKYSAFIWLTKGMKKVHRIDAFEECTEFDVIVELYPNFSVQR